MAGLDQVNALCQSIGRCGTMIWPGMPPQESRATLDKLANDAGRDPTAITVSVYGQPEDRDLIKRFHDAGAESIVVRPPTAR
jgi:hypothetical protein